MAASDDEFVFVKASAQQIKSRQQSRMEFDKDNWQANHFLQKLVELDDCNDQQDEVKVDFIEVATTAKPQVHST